MLNAQQTRSRQDARCRISTSTERGRPRAPVSAGRSAARPTATLVAEVDEAGPEDTEAAIAAAHAAFDDGPWPTTSSRERGDLLLRLADLLERDTDDIARMESLDTGKRFVESEYDVADVVAVFRHYGRIAAEESGRVVDTGNADVVSRIVHEPIGVCGLITPWNYPLLQVSLEGRAVPGRRQHLRAQAERADPALGDPPDAPARGGRAARGRRQPRPRRRRRLPVRRSRPTRASTWSPSPAGIETGRRIMAGGRGDREEGRPRARRQEPQHRLRRRRPRGRPRLRADRRLPALGPGLLGRRPAARRGVDPRRLRRRARRAGPAHPARRPLRRQGRDRAADQRGAPRQGRGVRRPRARRGRRAALRRRAAPTTPPSPTGSTTCRPSSTAARPRCR